MRKISFTEFFVLTDHLSLKIYGAFLRILLLATVIVCRISYILNKFVYSAGLKKNESFP